MFTYSYDALFSQEDCDEIIRLSRAEAQDTGGLVGASSRVTSAGPESAGLMTKAKRDGF